MEVLYPNCAGLDVHKETVVACSRRMTGSKVEREVRTFPTTTSGLLALSEWLSSLGATHIVMEATGVYWKPVWNILSDGEFELMLANAKHVKNVPGRKTDVNDATWLADLLAHGLIRASFVPNAATQEQRGLLARPIRPSWRRLPTAASRRDPTRSPRRSGDVLRSIIASCCGCIYSRSTRWIRQSPRSTKRSRPTSIPFAH